MTSFSKTTTSRGDVLGELSQGFLDVINTDKVRLSLQKMISLTNWNGCPNCRKKRIDFNSLEEDLEFRIHPQIKDFLSTYWFMPLEGKTDKIDHLVLHELLPQSQYELLKITKCYFNKKEYHYRNDGNYFLIGDFCCIDGNDSYMVHINNDTGEVFAVQNFDKISIKIANSIEELLGEMKGVWDM